MKIYPTITLWPDDRRRAFKVAIARNDSALARDATGRNNLHVSAKEALRLHQIGTHCELAAYHYFRGILPWYDFSEPFDETKADLGERIEVKGKLDPKHRLLIPHDRLKPDRFYVSVNGAHHPHYQIRGWWYGKDFDDTFLCEPVRGRRAYAVEDKDLNDPLLLLNLVLKNRGEAA